MEYIMFKQIIKYALLASLTCAMLACQENTLYPQDPVGPKDADLVGTWRMSVTVGAGTTMKITAQYAADHTLILTRKMAGVVPSYPDQEVDNARETFTWSLSKGVVKSTKTACEYASEPYYQLQSADCQAPVAKESAVSVSGKSMTVVDAFGTFVFTKD